MKNYLGRIIILVEDYDEALRFYEKNFGFGILFNHTTEAGERFLHVGPGGQNDAGIWFLKASGKEEKEAVGKQAKGQPVMVIYTDSLKELYEVLKTNDVEIKKEPQYLPEYAFLHCYDLYGNEIVVVELAA